MRLCEFDSFNLTRFSLVYRGSQHGFSSDSYHSRCNKTRSPTLVVIKSTNDYIFGGYTESEWNVGHTNGGFKIDYHAFLFSLVNKYNDPQKLRIKKGYEMFAVYSDLSCGPSFGDAYENSFSYTDEFSTAEFDLFVSDESNANEKSYTKLVDVNYKNGRLPTTEDPHYFQVKDIEVYNVEL